MNPKIILFFICLLLAACASSRDNSVRALNAVEDNTGTTWNKMREYAGVGKQPVRTREPVAQPRYCYRLYQDIACYGEPIPGNEDRLVAYQDSTAHTGYVLPPPKEKPALKPLPQVNVTTPPKIAEVPKNAPKAKEVSTLREIIFDPSELQPRELVPPKVQ